MSQDIDVNPADEMSAQPASLYPYGEVEAKVALVRTCPKVSRCSAAYCPATREGKHLPDERVCSHLLEAVKPGGTARLRGALPRPLAEAVITDARRQIALTGPLQIQLQRASKQGSRVVAIRRVAAMREGA